MRIRVTQKHIDGARRTSVTKCPIARAIAARLGVRVRVLPAPGTWVTWIGRKGRGGARKIPLSARVGDEAARFDSVGNMHPFSFTLNYEPERSRT